MGPQIFLYYKNTPPGERQLKKAFKTVIHHLKGWRIGLKRTRSVQRQHFERIWVCIGTHSSCLSLLILALASASSTLRCCRLSVRFMPGEPHGDCAADAWGRKRRQSRSSDSSMMVWGIRAQAKVQSGIHRAISGCITHQTLERHKNDGKVLAIEEDKSSTCTSTPKAKSHSSCTGPSGSFKFYFSL